MTSDTTLPRAEVNIFFDAACCVCAADGRLSSRKMAVVAELLRAVGVRMADDKLRRVIQARVQKLHDQGIDAAVTDVCRAIRDANSARLSRLLRRRLPLLDRDRLQSEADSRVVTLLLEACAAPPPPAISPVLPPSQRLFVRGTHAVSRFLIPYVAAAAFLAVTWGVPVLVNHALTSYRNSTPEGSFNHFVWELQHDLSSRQPLLPIHRIERDVRKTDSLTTPYTGTFQFMTVWQVGSWDIRNPAAVPWKGFVACENGILGNERNTSSCKNSPT